MIDPTLLVFTTPEWLAVGAAGAAAAAAAALLGECWTAKQASTRGSVQLDVAVWLPGV